jgi:hypothetical protein
MIQSLRHQPHQPRRRRRQRGLIRAIYAIDYVSGNLPNPPQAKLICQHDNAARTRLKPVELAGLIIVIQPFQMLR